MLLFLAAGFVAGFAVRFSVLRASLARCRRLAVRLRAEQAASGVQEGLAVFGMCAQERTSGEVPVPEILTPTGPDMWEAQP